MGLSFEGYEKFGANAKGRIKMTVGTTPTLLLTLAAAGTAIPAVTGCTHLYAHTTVIQTAEANTGYVSWSDENAVDAGGTTQNAVRYGAGREIPIRFNDLALLYFVASAAGQVVYIDYYYHNPSIDNGPVCGLKA